MSRVGHRSGPGRRAAFWRAFASLATLGILWALATPLMASPDEPDHANKAAAVVRGQFGGPMVAVPKGTMTWVVLPEPFTTTTALPACYAFQPSVSADCAPQFEGDPGEQVRTGTFAGRYNPVYYGLVGVPSLLWPSDVGLYGMRVVSALLCAALLAIAVVSAAEWRRPAWALAGVATAITPMALFLGGTVNPISLEIAAAVALWSTLLVMLRQPSPDLLARRMARVGLSTILLVNTRGLSPLWLAVIVLAVLMTAPWRSVRAAFSRGLTWAWVAAGAVASAFAVAWILLGETLGTTRNVAPGLTVSAAAVGTLGRTAEYLREMVGVFGWRDTPAPSVAPILWAMLVGLLVLLAACVARRRDLLLLAGLAIGAVALPVLLQAPQAEDTGYIWQGRYLLPVAVGLPLVAGTVLSRRLPAVGTLAPRALALVVALTSLAHVTCFVWAWHRYVVGLDGEWIGFEAEWQPPGTWQGLTVAFVVAALAWCAAVLAAGRGDGLAATVSGAAARASSAGTASPGAGEQLQGTSR